MNLTGGDHKAVPYGEALRLAMPASIAAAVTPLLGAIDVWALGHSEQPLDIAAVGLGAVIFSMLYWTFGFIRMSVAGLTAQAAGAGDEDETRACLLRGAAIGGSVGIALVLFQWPIGALSENLLALESNASSGTLNAARQYFDIRIWGAPFALATYAALGWLTARGRTDYLMFVSVGMTIINIILDYWFVVELHLGAAGVALGTLIAEVIGFIASLLFVAAVAAQNGGVRCSWGVRKMMDQSQLLRTLSVNRDIFLRTLLLSFSFAWFTQRSGAFGDVTLAANQALLQMFLFTGLALDGTAIAAETMVGRAMGRRDRKKGQLEFLNAVKATSLPACAAAMFFVALYWLFGRDIIYLLTPAPEIRADMVRYLPWIIVSPALVVVAFQLDGIFIGATRAREMRDSMLVSTAIFIPLSLVLIDGDANHGLWAAFSVYFMLRGVTLLWIFWRQKLWRF